jgi:hypothetical protein
MISLGLISFQTPLALLALLLLPVIWWLLRITPPRPHVVRFPPIRFLLELKDRLTTPDKSPWWLTALRILLAAILILALAGPTLDPRAPLPAARGAILLVLDDGWPAAPHWRTRITALKGIAARAARANRSMVLARTTPRTVKQELRQQPATELVRAADTLQPVPLTPDRTAALGRIKSYFATVKPAQVIWLADGLDHGAVKPFAAGLAALAPLTVFRAPAAATALVAGAPRLNQGKLTVPVLRAATAAGHRGLLTARSANGRTLADLKFGFAPGAGKTTVTLDLPLALRNQVSQLKIAGQNGAGGVFLLDDRWRQKAFGLAAGRSRAEAQPLLSALHYVTRALEEKAALKRVRNEPGTNSYKALIRDGLSALILADIGKLQPGDERLIGQWVERGGMLIRFAGPRLAGNNDKLVPVLLRRGDRALGGVLSWSKAQRLAGFDDNSPFFGLRVPGDVTVTRQVLAEPSDLAQAKVWARLTDGTPLVTARARGSGLIVLFHVPADPGWSSLPLSGLFVEMLHKLSDLAPAAIGTDIAGATSLGAIKELVPLKTLDGFGRLETPPAHVAALPARDYARIKVQAKHPPGLYGPATASRALNIGTRLKALKAIGPVPGATVTSYGPVSAIDLKPWGLLIAFCLFLIDTIAVFLLSGGLRATRLGAAAIVLGLLSMPLTPPPALAQDRAQSDVKDQLAIAATQRTRLAYVITGRADIDRVSLAGLTGLSQELTRRTAFEPGAPIGLNLERDELTFFPLIYWPISSDSEIPSARAIAKLDIYMKRGGTVLFDTRDHQRSIPGPDGRTGPNTQRLRQMLAKFDIPTLERVPEAHVLTKAFYLLQSFPGRWSGGQLWVEANTRQRAGSGKRGTSAHDGVSSIIIGSNDYAAAWARDERGRPLFPVVPGGDLQREKALRTGINLVMYVLTGNYKADQVHVPALLERLGQ